jgi:serine/threonine protein kinase
MSKITVKDRFFILPNQPERGGGTATVRKARDLYTDEPVAVKLFDGANLEDDLLEELFLRDKDSLTTLRHPNIVHLVDCGYDENLKKHFIALEWIEENLTEYLERTTKGSLNFDTLVDQVILPLLEGLSLAHSRRIIHRDIKPSNILVTKDGVPKLSDFGIAKLMSSARLGMTVRDFRSPPFTAPDQSLDTPDFSTDLFSLGVTILDCLKSDPARKITHDRFDDAISDARLTGDAEKFVRRLIAFDPSVRPKHAGQTLEELLWLKQNRPRSQVDRPTLHLSMPNGMVSRFVAAVQGKSRDEVQKVILRDLASAPAIIRDRKDTEGTGYNLFGEEFRYFVRIETREPRFQDARFVLLEIATSLPPSLLSKERDQAMPISAEFTFDEVFAVSKAQETLREVCVAVERFSQGRLQDQLVDEERNLFRRWRNILTVKRAIEEEKSDPIAYNGLTVSGRRVYFNLRSPVEEDIISQSRRIDALKGDPIRGDVESIRDGKLELYVNSGDIKQLPHQGMILFDIENSKAAIRRQERALDETQFERTVRSDLKSLLVDPSQCRHPQDVDEIHLIQDYLDETKQEALRIALGAEDFALVQGPPGAGKTTWIAELICQFLQRNAHLHPKILLTAQTHIAVDNALEKIAELRPDLMIVRLGKAERIASKVETYRLENRMDTWREQVKERCEAFIEAWAREHGIVDSRRQLGDILTSLEQRQTALTELEAEAKRIRAEKENQTRFAEEIKRLEAVVWEQAALADNLKPKEASPGIGPLVDLADTYVTLGMKLADKFSEIASFASTVTELQRELNDCEEALQEQRKLVDDLREQIALTLGDETLIDADMVALQNAVKKAVDVSQEQTNQLMRLQTIQKDWLLKFGTGEGFEKALVGVADLVAGTCVGIAAAGRVEDAPFDLVVIDEASKATPTETLIAIGRGKRWVLVGDHKQLPPFVEVGNDKTEFLNRFELKPEDLRATLFDRLRASLPPTCQARLSTQHRMVAAIGNLISHCFYENQLESRRADADGHPFLSKVLHRPITWFSTERIANRQERSRTNSESGNRSYANEEEARRICAWLETVERQARTESYKGTVGVIAGYLGQKNLLSRHIDPDDTQRWQALRIEINTVDAFQGREVDVVVYSVTRSNVSGTIGHLKSAERLNVALSRGRDALVIFGDAQHCRTARTLDNPFHVVIEYIEKHKDTCAVEVLREGR